MSVGFREAFSRINCTNHLELILGSLKQAHCRINFLGKRIVCVQDPKEEIPLKEVVSRIMDAGFQQDLSLQERLMGIEIVEKIKQLYQEGHWIFGRKDNQSLCFTALSPDLFRAYTNENFQKEFGIHFPQEATEDMVDSWTFYPEFSDPLLLVNENFMRKRLSGEFPA